MKKILMKRDPYLILYFIMQPLAAICDVLSAKALSDAVDFAMKGKLDGIAKYIIAFAALIAISYLVELSHNWLLWKLFGSRTIALRKACHRKILFMPYMLFTKKNTGEYISNLTEDVEQAVDGYLMTILTMYYDIVVFAITFIALLYINPYIGIFALAISMLQAFIPIISAKKQETAGEEASDASEGHIKSLRETVSAFATGRIFHIEDKLAGRYDKVQKKAARAEFNSEFKRNIFYSIADVFTQINQLGVFLFSAFLALKGFITVADIVAASQLIIYFSYPVQNLNGEFADLRNSRASIRKLSDILDGKDDLGGNEEINSITFKMLVTHC